MKRKISQSFYTYSLYSKNKEQLKYTLASQFYSVSFVKTLWRRREEKEQGENAKTIQRP